MINSKRQRKMPLKTEPIQFPILYQYENLLIPSGKEIIRFAGFKHEGSNIFSYLESAKKIGERFHWLIGADGLFREFKSVGVSGEWARWLKPLIVLTRVRCEVRPGRSITTGALRALIKSLTTGEDFRHKKHLEEYLRDFPENQTFTRDMFLEFMGEAKYVKEEYFPEDK